MRGLFYFVDVYSLLRVVLPLLLWVVIFLEEQEDQTWNVGGSRYILMGL